MTRRVLMCPPLHYGIEYEINPWMHRANRVDRRRALVEWRNLYRELLQLGIEVELVRQEAGLPDMTFTANAGLALGTTYIPSNFRYPERQAESAYFSRWFESHEYRLQPVPQPHYWEGEGDVLWSLYAARRSLRLPLYSHPKWSLSQTSAKPSPPPDFGAPFSKAKKSPLGSASFGVFSPSRRQRSMKCSCDAARSVAVEAAHFRTNSPGVIASR